MPTRKYLKKCFGGRNISRTLSELAHNFWSHYKWFQGRRHQTCRQSCPYCNLHCNWYTRTDLPEICGKQNVRATARDYTGQNTKDTHSVPRYKLKFVTPTAIEAGPPRWKAVILQTTPHPRLRHLFNYYQISMKTSKILLSSECSVQGQVFHCKVRYQGCSSAQRQVFHCKFRHQSCSSAQRHVFHRKLRN